MQQAVDALAIADKLVNEERARAVMAELGIDALIGAEDENLYYLSSHAPDSVLCHFYDNWAAAILPRHDGAPPCLVTSEYDSAYVVTHRSWMPEIRLYGAEWSSASGVIKKISAGEGVDTDLRGSLRALHARTRPSRVASLVDAIVAYVTMHLPPDARRLAFDDLRLGQAVAERLGGRATIVDARWIFRRIRLVKTAAEIAALRRAAAINEQGVLAAARAVAPGAPWSAMSEAFRAVLARAGAKPSGERGMIFAAGPDGGFVLDHDYVASKTFKRGDGVVLDAISSLRLYHADIARTAFVGAANGRQRALFKAVREVLAECESKVVVGAHTRDIEHHAAHMLEARGLEPRLATLVFHPIGLNIFDYGSAEATSAGWRLEADTVLNFEVFYRDAEVGGVHLEDSLLLTARGIENFSTIGRELMIVG